MQFQNLEEIIDFAIEKEKEAAEFYETAAKEASMSGVKEMLLEFADQERNHQHMLENIEDEGIRKNLENYDWKWIKDIKRSDYMVDMNFQPGMAYNEILAIAMKREEKALALYNQLLEQARTDAQKKVFQLLCQEEAKHKQFLETRYDDYMAKMGD
jgi:hypothetical protein